MSTHNTENESIRIAIREWLEQKDREIELWVQHFIEQLGTGQNDSNP
ncbi:MAG: hypothetical protein JJU37_09920 [Balneolaceae bacterium]|nr:hypothetical protein [Balneolaceae bacterium]